MNDIDLAEQVDHLVRLSSEISDLSRSRREILKGASSALNGTPQRLEGHGDEDVPSKAARPAKRRARSDIQEHSDKYLSREQGTLELNMDDDDVYRSATLLRGIYKSRKEFIVNPCPLYLFNLTLVSRVSFTDSKREKFNNGRVGDGGEAYALLEEEEADPEGKRSLTYQMQKNKGLTPHRNKLQRNPRKKHRVRYSKAVVKAKSRMGGRSRTIKATGSGGYLGEDTGIRTKVTRSRRF